MATKKVLYIESGVGFGGSSKYLVDLFKYLDPKAYEPMLACYQMGKNFEAVQKLGYPVFNLEVKLFKTEPGQSALGNYLELLGYLLTVVPAAVMKLVSLIRREKIGILHLNNEILTHLPGIIAGKLTGTPVVVHFQGYRKLSRLEKMFGGWPDRYLALSHAGAKLFSSELGREVTALHHAVDLEEYKLEKFREPGEIRKKYAGEKLVGVVGRLVSWKGQDVFFQAVAEVVKKAPSARFLLVGDDPDEGKPFRAKLEKMARDLGIEERVVFMGWQNNVPAILSDLDFFVHTSTRPEPFGIVIIEAMAMAKPVIGTNAGGVPEIIEDGQCGYLVPCGDAPAMAEAMLKILADDNRALQMGKAARKRVEDMFDIRMNAEKLQEVYQKL